jgi:hypothetical protein
MRHMTAVAHCDMHRSLTNTRLVDPPIEPKVGHPVGSITKIGSLADRNNLLRRISYCLNWLSVIVPTLVQSKTPFSDSPMLHRTLCGPPNCHWMVRVLLQGNVKLNFELFFTAYLMVGGGHGRILEISGSCFVKQKCNCGRLCATAWVFVDVK